MRALVALLSFVSLIGQIQAETAVTVAQLEHFLTFKHMPKESDAEIADTLSSVTLEEQLTIPALTRITSETRLGPKAAEQLYLLAAISSFRIPPFIELPMRPVPNSATQLQIIELARNYVTDVLPHLPDFLATRTTLSYDNTPQFAGSKHSKPKVQMHFVRESRREIAYRNNREVEVSSEINSTGPTNRPLAPSGLATSGEFGPILAMVLSDSFKGDLTWSRWQKSDTGTVVAVFHYTIPRSSSHYLIDFCCYQRSKENPEALRFLDKPGYHGEVYLDPVSGVVNRVTLEAELSQNDPVIASAIAVQYGKVVIDGKDYICPIQSIASTEVSHSDVESDGGVSTITHFNEVRFLNYHKFGSTERILPESSDAIP